MIMSIRKNLGLRRIKRKPCAKGAIGSICRWIQKMLYLIKGKCHRLTDRQMIGRGKVRAQGRAFLVWISHQHEPVVPAKPNVKNDRIVSCGTGF